MSTLVAIVVVVGVLALCALAGYLAERRISAQIRRKRDSQHTGGLESRNPTTTANLGRETTIKRRDLEEMKTP